MPLTKKVFLYVLLLSILVQALHHTDTVGNGNSEVSTDSNAYELS